MSSGNTVLITAATGNVGIHAAACLLEEGAEVRALVLPGDPDVGRLPAGVQLCEGDLKDPAGVEAALDGVDGVLWMWPFFTLGVETAPAVLEKFEKHVRRVALVSSVGVHIGLERRDNNCHAYLEELLRDSGVEWTFLRTTGFMANALGFAGQIKKGGVVHFPYGEAARTAVHEADLGAVAARTLTGEGHARQAYLITGPEVLTQREQVNIIGEVLGRELGWEDVHAEQARAQMVATGWPPSYADGALDYFAMLTKEPEVGSKAVEKIIGRPAHTFREWAEEHINAFR
ncbi:SDR family oxidoreductase [Amycolatopsis pithecellobii]|uniref:NAD(P)H-binding protein n=1 Tax=Amycolatopsis pithecellobii TaxID=664692 RepID=A0A6N7YZY0_9PSEU|nr:NAD(P)H-binding protein [Amycolatopsis pithecellobii]MTD54523.1 NAD(P)H-binding protein [Amycolatopsis pithecellobii]